jgi:glycosyltransferase involved in cell wall biosynthesis
MFGAGLGGLEQVFVDHGEALHERGHAVLDLVTPGAKVIPALRARAVPYWEVGNFSQYDLLARARIRARLKWERPDVVIAQGNRAISLLRPAARGVAPVIAVCHGVNVRRAIGAEAIIAINEDMRRRLREAGQPEDRVLELFNMVRRPDPLPAPTPFRAPPVISAMGRFVPKKGFEVFIDALARLRDEGVAFEATLAGSGELDEDLKRLAAARGLGDSLCFPGWIADKAAFFARTDIFCFTSHHDVCPVVLLEAFVHAKPVVLTDCPGPREISEDGVDSLLFPIDDGAALAARLRALIDDPALAARIAAAAQRKILERHTFEQAGSRLEAIAKRVAESWRDLANRDRLC